MKFTRAKHPSGTNHLINLERPRMTLCGLLVGPSWPRNNEGATCENCLRKLALLIGEPMSPRTERTEEAAMTWTVTVKTKLRYSVQLVFEQHLRPTRQQIVLALNTMFDEERRQIRSELIDCVNAGGIVTTPSRHAETMSRK